LIMDLKCILQEVEAVVSLSLSLSLVTVLDKCQSPISALTHHKWVS